MSRYTGSGDTPIHDPIIHENTRLITNSWVMFFNSFVKDRRVVDDTHARRLSHHAPTQSKRGTIFVERDRNVYYVNRNVTTVVDANSASGAAVLNVASTRRFGAGQIIVIGEGTARQETKEILSVTAGVSLTLTTNLSNTHLAADADTVSIKDPIWAYESGTMRDVLANIPTDLTETDEDFLFHSTDYLRTWRWNGAGWEYAPGERNWVEFTTALGTLPDGWALCDGSTITVTLPDATTDSFDTPDLIGNYIKGGVYTGATEPAVDPTLSGGALATDPAGAHDHGGTTGGSTLGPSTTTVVASGVGATVASSGHSHSFTASIPGESDHTHDIDLSGATLTPGEPAHVLLLPIVKL